MKIYETIINQLINYLNNLDWSYMITFILLVYIVNKTTVKAMLYKLFRFRLQTRYKALIIGIGYGALLYYLRGHDRNVERLFLSFLFALFFHKMLLDQIVGYLSKGFRSITHSVTTGDSNEEEV